MRTRLCSYHQRRVSLPVVKGEVKSERSDPRQGYRSDSSEFGCGSEGNEGDFCLSDTEAQVIRSASFRNEVQDSTQGPATSVCV